MKLLIADDNPLTRRRAEAAVVKWGFLPFTVTTGTAAWDILNTPTAPRLALLDWRMPGLDGLEICRRIRMCASDHYTYLILLTGSSCQESLVEGLKAGADDFVRKPFSADELEQRLRTGCRIIELEDRLRTAHEELRIQAAHDGLTGVWNRGEILQLLEEVSLQSTQQKRPYAVMMVDIDHFKGINDQLGHQAGDKILKSVADQISRFLGTSDHVGRYGGEEFLVVLPNADLEIATELGEQIRHAVMTQACQSVSLPFRVSVSIGIAATDGRSETTPSDLIAQADLAMYRAKDDGRNCLRLSSGAQPSAGLSTEVE